MKKLLIFGSLVLLTACKKNRNNTKTSVFGIVYDKGNQTPLSNALVYLTSNAPGESNGQYSTRTNQNGSFIFVLNTQEVSRNDTSSYFILSYNDEEKTGTQGARYDHGNVDFSIDTVPNYFKNTTRIVTGKDNRINLFSVFFAHVNWYFTNIPSTTAPTDSFSITLINSFGTKRALDYVSASKLHNINSLYANVYLEIVSARTTVRLNKRSNGVLTFRDTTVDIPPDPQRYTLYLPYF